MAAKLKSTMAPAIHPLLLFKTIRLPFVSGFGAAIFKLISPS
jgi:hypothetical protein